jgi:tetratricopeptide (TPR) repeat protein
MRRWIIALSVLIAGETAGVARAQLAPPHTVTAHSVSALRASEQASRAAQAEIAGDPKNALKWAAAAIQADPNDPWGYYDRADALTELRRTDEAVSSYQEAEKRFTGENQSWGRSIAIYGEAHALSEAGRCDDARSAYERYASYVEKADARSAEMARRYAKACVGRPSSR